MSCGHLGSPSHLKTIIAYQSKLRVLTPPDQTSSHWTQRRHLMAFLRHPKPYWNNIMGKNQPRIYRHNKSKCAIRNNDMFVQLMYVGLHDPYQEQQILPKTGRIIKVDYILQSIHSWLDVSFYYTDFLCSPFWFTKLIIKTTRCEGFLCWYSSRMPLCKSHSFA